MTPPSSIDSPLASEFWARVQQEDLGDAHLFNEQAQHWACLYREEQVMLWVGVGQILCAQRFDSEVAMEMQWLLLIQAYDRLREGQQRAAERFPHINLTKVHSQEAADRIVANLQGVSSMQFIVEVCPHQGEFLVNITTRRQDTTKEELTEMLLMVLASMAFARPSGQPLPTLKTTQQLRDDWRRDVPIRGLLRNDFMDMLCDDVDTLTACIKAAR